ncbi:hypothetical protein GCM10028806_28070 [Spirosoma terrae]
MILSRAIFKLKGEILLISCLSYADALNMLSIRAQIDNIIPLGIVEHDSIKNYNIKVQSNLSGILTDEELMEIY